MSAGSDLTNQSNLKQQVKSFVDKTGWHLLHLIAQLPTSLSLHDNALTIYTPRIMRRIIIITARLPNNREGISLCRVGLGFPQTKSFCQ